MKTSYIAIIAIVIVAVIGVGAYFAFFNNNGGSSGGLDADVVKSDIVKGDFVEFDIDITDSRTDTETYRAEGFVEVIYSLPEDADKTGTGSVTYKGKEIQCDIYTYTSTLIGTAKYWVNSGAVYKTETDLGDLGTAITVLEDTNLDLTTEEQTIDKGSFIKMTSSQNSSLIIIKLATVINTTLTVTAADPEEDEYTVSHETKTTGKGSFKLTVASVDGQNITIEELPGTPIPKDVVFSLLDINKFKQYLEKEQIKYSEGQKIDLGTVKTFAGDRKLTEQQFKIDSEGEMQAINVDYGEKGAIYKLDIPKTSMLSFPLTITLKGTSMFVKG